ncbi:NmrA family transcriptional regulator [Capsulimonas corticalis]|uniref:NmrA family transcriptional regulator n=1 Tax=Capsulimonas corticalis TaxID=2219043 RepID=A0A402CUU9_9BACT|nr:NmrA family NAD(P)-binding protein [Capsulimonas corticalis]BDI29117.1 NmrA family transcriptional regulator [Capsulimonas corticalis]
MNNPRILVLSAAGKTGLPTAIQLLGDGFPVTAFVRQEDKRSELLKSRGADIIAGSVTDMADMRRAMEGARRAYFCAPLEEGYLTAGAVFTAAAAEQGLESLVVMSQWLSHPSHPTVHTRECWLTDRMLALLPGTGVTTINVGFFADNDMAQLPFAAQFGILPLPYGTGLNAPPSNEDIARVIAAVLARPEGHSGQTYRPTGSTLLSPPDIAAIVGKVLGRSVRYVDAPAWMVARVLKGAGYSEYAITQILQYAREYQQGAFAMNAPTDVVRKITGREPENYETIVRRYAAKTADAKPSLGAAWRLITRMAGTMLSPAPNTIRHLHSGDFSAQTHITFSADSSEWRQIHDFPASTTRASLVQTG